jgi:hypothetical protein
MFFDFFSTNVERPRGRPTNLRRPWRIPDAWSPDGGSSGRVQRSVPQEEAWIPPYSVPDHQLSVTSYHSRPNLSHFESRMTFDCRGLNPRQSVRKYVRRLCHILFSRKLRLKPRANCRQNRGKPRATPGKLRAQALKKRGHAIQNRCRTAFFRGKPRQDRAKPRQDRAKQRQTAPNSTKQHQTAPNSAAAKLPPNCDVGPKRRESNEPFFDHLITSTIAPTSNSFVMVSRGASKTKGPPQGSDERSNFESKHGIS